MPKQDRSKLQSFSILPVLGRRTDVPPNHHSLFEQVGEKVFKTHDVGGTNFDLERRPGACSKAYGYKKWSAEANSKATKCLGLYELYDGSNRDYIFFDNGRFFVYDTSKYPNEAVLNFDAGTDAFVVGETATDNGGNTPSGTIRTVSVSGGSWVGNNAAGTLVLYNLGTGAFTTDSALTSASGAAVVNGALAPITFATDNIDLYSIVKVGDYIVFADRAEHMPYRWINGDDYITKLIQSGTEYKFRYLEVFQRRVWGLYSDQTNGKMEIRYSTDWPITAFTSLNFPAANHLYVPNDDTIVGGQQMGQDRLFVYCENSIHQIVFYPDLSSGTAFKIYTVVPDQGAVSHHSVVSLGDRHFLFNKDYGFCEYRGASEFPYGGQSISDPIKQDIRNIDTSYYNLITGHFVPLTNEIVWTVPCEGSLTPNKLFFYNIITKQWRVEEKEMRFVASWRLADTYTWADLITDLDTDGDGTAYWIDAGSNPWSHYVGSGIGEKLVYANTDGHLYYHTNDDYEGTAYDGYRIEPILDFGDSNRKDQLKEIWFDLARHGDFSIRVDYRSGQTAGEVKNAAWEPIGTIPHNSPDRALVKHDKTSRLHQIRWGTYQKNEPFEVSKITFKFLPGQTH